MKYLCFFILMQLPHFLVSQSPRFELEIWTSGKKDFHTYQSKIDDNTYNDQDWFRNTVHFQYGMGLRYHLSPLHSLSLGMQHSRFGYTIIYKEVHPYYGFIQSDMEEQEVEFSGFGVVMDYQLSIYKKKNLGIHLKLGHQITYPIGIELEQKFKNGGEKEIYLENISGKVHSSFHSQFIGFTANMVIWKDWAVYIKPLFIFESNQRYPKIQSSNRWGVELRTGIKWLM